jgi:hypothetical protein
MEIMLLTLLLVVFVAAAYQVHLVNQAVFRSISAVHQVLFRRAFERNCAEARPECEYSQDPIADGLPGPGGVVVWSPNEIPEARIPVLGIFRRQGLDADLRISSNRPEASSGAAECAPLPCKRTRVGSGTYKSLFGGVELLRSVRADPDQVIGSVELAAVERFLAAVY